MRSSKMKKNETDKKQNTNKKTDKQTILLTVLFIGAPVFISLLLMAIKWILQGYVALPVTKWNDEAAYIKLIQTYSRFPAPKGYWGFDSNHALLGTGSAWSAAIIAPYSIPAIIFPAGYSFVYVCNLLYMVLANTAFLYLVKPDKKRLIKRKLALVA